ncbi:hypothetical protein [Lysobacter solisilvae (ex Woo and Kim 2020)]|uniref:Uncharacterized protein n=1 Tax=Agrilutibacter terrestris TaxID=2865112 RepID=A0A7H0G092_9GAMM|nr:hypothetical protein [Lysobacter terrestris]QNP41708.1 hypothetical protein H8B22_05735 [Lysobacter terrestris]
MSSDDTSAQRHAALLAKREQLYAQQAERMAQQRHAENVAHFERYLGAALAQAGVRHELLWSTETRRGPLTRYPIGFASVRWDRVPHAVSTPGGSDAELKELFDAALAALAIAPATEVIVDWCIVGRPRVALSAADASTHAVALMRHASDMWLYADDAPWLIEVYHEGSVTYAAQPGREEDAGDGWRRR